MLQLVSFVLLSVLSRQILAVPVWGQCGGIGWTGSTTCDSGSTCVAQNAYYSQCIPGGSGGSTTGGGSTTTASPPTSTGASGALNAKFVSHGKKFWGSAADPNIINNSNVQRLLRDVFGQITPENSLKWDATEGTRGQFTFTNADTIVNWAVSNGKMVRGHTLVWHAQLPTWVSNINDRNTLTSVIQTHISNVAGRYKGKIYAWDVCNEILNEDGSLRSSVFSKVLGQDFVGIAFRAARAADPSAKLYINDYNLDNTGWSSPKVEGMVKLVNSVNAGGKIIDGIGTQTHLGSGGGAGVLSAMQRLASTGLDIAITELDIGGASSTDYVNVAKACLSVPQCVSVTSWGVSDANSWRSDDNPTLFDRSYNPKAAYNAVLAAL